MLSALTVISVFLYFHIVLPSVYKQGSVAKTEVEYVSVAKMMSDDEEKVVCCICEQVEDTLSRIIECAQCKKSVHFRCKKIFGNAIAKVKKQPYLCSVECIDMSAHSKKQQGSYDDVVSEIRLLGQSVRDASQESAHVRRTVEQTQSQMVVLIETTRHIEESQEFLAKQFDELQSNFNDFKQQLSGLSAENNKMRKELDDLTEKYTDLLTTFERLEINMDRINRSSVSKNAVILGIPVTEDENAKELVDKLAISIGCELQAGDVVNARRMAKKNAGNRSAPILVTFSTEQIKEKFLEHKRSRGILPAGTVCGSSVGPTARIVVRDELTDFGRELYNAAKEFQTSAGYKYVWPGRNGKILLRRQDGAKVEEVSSKQQLVEMLRRSAKRTLNSSSNSAGSPDHRPASKSQRTSKN